MSTTSLEERRRHAEQSMSLANALLDVSHKLAFARRGWDALAAQVAADVALLDSIITDEDKDISAGAFSIKPDASEGFLTAQDVIASMRQQVSLQVSPEVASRWESELDEADHLSPLPAPSEDDVIASEERRLNGQPSAERVRALREYARRMYGAAETLLERRSPEHAFRATYRADLAEFEAACIELSEGSGDWSMANASVRWELGCWKLEMVDMSAIYSKGVEQVRDALRYALNTEGSEPQFRSITDPYEPVLAEDDE